MTTVDGAPAVARVAPEPPDATRAPLAGLTVAVTRPRERAAALVAALEALGATVLVAPAIAVLPPESWAPLDARLARLAAYDWLALTSAAAVGAVADRLAAGGAGPAPHAAPPRIAAVGAATARAARERLGRVDLVPALHAADALADALPRPRGARVLFPCADRARAALPTVLRARGAVVDRVVAYRTAPTPDALAPLAARLRAGAVDALLLASPSAAPAAARALGARDACARAAPAVCIGPTTAAAARDLGVRVAAVAAAPTDAALADAACACLGGPRS